MSGAKDRRAGEFGRLVKTTKAQGSLLEAMREVTQGALEAVKKNDTDRLEEALSQREKLMRQVEAIQKRERELRSKAGERLPPEFRTELETAEDHIIAELKRTIELNIELEQELHELKQRLDSERDQVNKLRQTAEGYRPKELPSEGLFVDWKR